MRFNRQQFEVSNMLREKVERSLKDKKKVKPGELASDALVPAKRKKRRTKSALDVLIPKKH